jgi:hypothetical protein
MRKLQKLPVEKKNPSLGLQWVGLRRRPRPSGNFKQGALYTMALPFNLISTIAIVW